MSKVIVQTTGQFMLVNGDVEIDPLKPTLVERTAFINNALSNGKLKLLLADAPNDAVQADVEGLLTPKETKPKAKDKAN
jgi:hypothetical protein